MLRKTKSQNNIDFLINNVESQSSKNNKDTQNNKQEDFAKTIKEQKSKRLSCKDDGLKNSHSILAGHSGGLTDMGGPKKHIKMETSNTIWDTSRNENLIKSIDSKEETRQEKQKIAELKQKQEKDRIDSIVNSLKETDNRKASSILSSREQSSETNKYKSPTANISIFDQKEFERLPEKTSGEKVSEENKIRKSQKDESWKSNGKCLSSKDVTSKLFDNLFNK